MRYSRQRLGLVFVNVLAGTLTIPVIRPLMASIGAPEPMMHAFVGANMLGAILGAPWLALASDKTGARPQLVAFLSLLDAVLLFACTMRLPLGLLLGARAVQGAASVGALSILMSEARDAARAPGHGGTAGSTGAAVVAAIAAGPMFGGWLLRHCGLQAPFTAAGICALTVGVVGMWTLPRSASPRAQVAQRRRLLQQAPALWIPVAWIAAERFSVGCFVVTFSLFAHGVLGCSDGRVATLLTCFMLPFAGAMWPLGKLTDLMGRTLMILLGGLVYGSCFLALGHATATTVVGLLFIMGCASAAIYTPALCLTAALSPEHLRSTAMALGNAAGALGMLLGTVTAGVLTSVLRRHGLPASEIYAWIFRAAAAAPLCVLLATASALPALERRAPRVRTERNAA
jgi:DHA1 family tetracycline resistance protein-like MFS transporter